MYKGLIECTHIINIFFAIYVLFFLAFILFLFISFWLCWFFIGARGFPLVPDTGAPLSLQHMGFSAQGLLLWSTGSSVQTQQLWCMGLITP